MASPRFFYKPIPPTIFNPHRLDKHISENQSRALAIFDIVGHLIQQNTAPIEQARSALDRLQPYQAIHALHNLNASASNLGGLRVCEIAGELEILLETCSTMPIIHNLLDSLERELQLLLKAAAEWLDLRKTAHAQNAVATQDETRLPELIHYLAESNLKAVELYEDISELLQALLAEDDFNQLDTAINDLDFPLALQFIEHQLAY
jgi:HPt (histidine-containing phosphotransfer) domain-containing protein